jgi:hypothetical protein
MTYGEKLVEKFEALVVKIAHSEYLDDLAYEDLDKLRNKIVEIIDEANESV